MVNEQLQYLLPFACEWVEQQEKIIIENGVELNDDQRIDAYLIGVKGIEKVRLLKVPKIPSPINLELKYATDLAELLGDWTIGASFRYGIYIKDQYWQQRRLIVHELTHAMQYERLGGIEFFLKQYLDECLKVGYPLGELEQEAFRMEKLICT